MDTSNDKPDYPPRLYEVGKAPFQNHSMNHNCYLNKFSIVRESLGEEVWESLKESSVGVILKLSEMKYIFSSKTVHHFLTNQLRTTKLHEMWSVIGGQPIRFSLHEFSEITGLKCHPFEDEDTFNVDHTGFWEKMGVMQNVGPCWEELLEALSNCATWSFSQRKMVGLLCVLSVGIFGLHKTSRLPLNAAKRVLDYDTFETFPWGRVAFDSLVSGVKVVSYENNSYHVKGCVHVLQIWAYESVDVLGEKFGKIREDKDVVPLLRWKGSRDRFILEEIINKEIEAHGKVRVRNLSIKPLTEIYPQWVDETDDSRVHNLIADLLEKRFSPTFYDAVQTKVVSKRKSVSLIPTTRKSKKGKPIEITCSQKDEGFKEGKNSQAHGGEGSSMDVDEQKSSKEGMNLDDVAIGGMSKLINAFGEKLESFQVTLATSLTGLAATMEAKFDAKQNAVMEPMEGRISKLENLVEAIYNRLQPSEDVGPDGMKVDESKKAESIQKKEQKTKKINKTPSPTPSWLVQKVETSQKEFPIACAIKKPTMKKEKSNSNVEATSKMTLLTIKKEKKSPVRVKKRNLRSTKEDDEIEDVTMELRDKEKGVCLSESYNCSNPVEEKAQKTLDTCLVKMLATLENPNFCGQLKRGKQRSKVLGSQFVGNSTMKRLIPENAIEPTSLVDEKKLKKLLDFIKKNESTPIGRNRGQKLLKLMTPKDRWPKKEQNFGWLHDGHMEDVMKMFTLRSVSDNSPYSSRRIAFLDPIFVKKIVSDLLQFDMGPKNFMFPDGYTRAVNGNFYDDAPTNLKWFVDVDHLYITHHIKPGHWAALDVNLKEERIDVYDSIESTSSNNQVLTSCRPFAKMIPYLLSIHVPAELRKKKTAMFTIKRVKGIPQNIQTGDCGVYALKYIERLAMGDNFDGLCDANMPAFRLQLACDVFTDIHLPESNRCLQIPELKDEDLDDLDASYTS